MEEEIKLVIKKISDEHVADVYLFSATINDTTVDNFINLVKNIGTKNQNCYLILTTDGGDPDAGYRMTKFIKRKYTKFILCVLGSCKSTGTLIAIGADEIIMGDFGEFGPLDIQLTKDDEMSNTSGLSYMQSLNSLNEQAFNSFEASFMRLKRRSGYTITTKTAAEIASKISVGIISPISAQIDPLKLGEVQRAIRIADAYGKRLSENKNLLNHLISGFPSHSFVIDYEECLQLFGDKVVSYATDLELSIEKLLFRVIRQETEDDIVINLVERLVDNIESDKSAKTDNDLKSIKEEGKEDSTNSINKTKIKKNALSKLKLK